MDVWKIIITNPPSWKWESNNKQPEAQIGQVSKNFHLINIFMKQAVFNWHTGIPNFTGLHLLLFYRCCIFFFFIIEGFWHSGNSVSNKSIGTTFPKCICSLFFLSLQHILIILKIFQTFSFLLYLLWWSVSRDLWYYYCKKMSHWKLT